jgi:hypothetical protein
MITITTITRTPIIRMRMGMTGTMITGRMMSMTGLTMIITSMRTTGKMMSTIGLIMITTTTTMRTTMITTGIMTIGRTMTTIGLTMITSTITKNHKLKKMIAGGQEVGGENIIIL